MTRTTALVWKEYRETRWFLWGGLALFVGPMLFELWANYSRGNFYSDSGEGIVLGLGGVLAVFLAIALTARDLHSTIDTFWRSRAISVTRIMLTKYAVGLAVLLTVTLVTMVFQEAIRFIGLRHLGSFPLTRPFANWVIFGHTFTLLLVYSVAFLIGCLVRQAAQAAILSLSAGLLIYFVPLLVPQLRVVDLFALLTGRTGGHRMDWGHYSLFVTAMTGGSAVALAFSLAAVRGRWRVRADQRLIYWSLGGVLILLLATAAFALRSNMVLVAQADLNLPVNQHGWQVAQVRTDGTSGVVLLKLHRDINNSSSLADYAVCRLEFDESVPRVGPPMLQLPGEAVPAWSPDFEPQLAWSADRPDRVQVLRVLGHQRQLRQGAWVEVFDSVSLLTVSLPDAGAPTIVHQLDLPSFAGVGATRMAGSGNRLFALKSCFWGFDANKQDLVHSKGPPWSLTTIDISGANGPVIVRSQEPERAGVSGYPDSQSESVIDETHLELLPLDSLPPDERLRVSLELTIDRRRFALVGSRLVCLGRDGLTVSELQPGQDLSRAHWVAFAQAGQHRTLPLLAYRSNGSESVAVDAQAGVVYFTLRTLGGAVTAYDVRDPSRPRRIGHYAVPEGHFSVVTALPDGRALLGGADLSIVKLPGR